GEGAGELEKASLVQDVMSAEAGHGLEGRAAADAELVAFLEQPLPDQPAFVNVETKECALHEQRLHWAEIQSKRRGGGGKRGPQVDSHPPCRRSRSLF